MRFTTTTSLAVLVITWAVTSQLAQSDAFPGPLAVGAKMLQESMNGELWVHLGATFGRVMVAFGLAWAVGIGVGAALGRSDTLDRWFWPWVNTFLNMPALVIIVICYLGLGMSELAAVLAVVINKAPLIATNVRDGVRQFESKYEEFALIYRLSWLQKVRLIWLPQLEPFLFTALRTVLSLTWKIILVVELLGRSSGIGFQIHLYFQLFEVDMILAYALSFMIAMQLIELSAVRPLEQRVQQWRKDGQLV
jgi:NitT/TauT family transport system permease protein